MRISLMEPENVSLSSLNPFHPIRKVDNDVEEIVNVTEVGITLEPSINVVRVFVSFDPV